MNKKIIIGLIIIILIGIGIWWATRILKPEKPIVPVAPKRQKVEKNVIAALGNSSKKDTLEAFTEALDEVNQKLKGAKVNFVIVYSNVKYDNKKGLQMIKDRLETDKIFGSSSSMDNIDSDGYYLEGGLTILAVSSPYLQAKIGGVVMKKGEIPQEVAKRLMKGTLKEGKKPDLVLVAPTFSGMEEEFIEGFEEVLGTKVPILGGTAGDNTVTGKWVSFAGTEVIPGGFDKGGITIAVIYTDLKFGYTFTAGFKAMENSGIITKMIGKRIIAEIDGRPAQEVYNQWAGISYPEWTLGLAHLNPLASKYIDVHGNERLVIICPFPKKGPDPEHNLMIFHDFKEGKRVWLTKGNWGTFLSRARTIPEDALLRGEISKEKAVFGIYVFCAGANLTIPEERRPEQAAYIKAGLGAPFVGQFAMGEQGHIPGIGNHHSNLSSVMVVFSQELK